METKRYWTAVSSTWGEGSKPCDLNAIRERICQDCYLPQSQVFLLKCPCDLEPDDFESNI